MDIDFLWVQAEQFDIGENDRTVNTIEYQLSWANMRLISCTLRLYFPLVRNCNQNQSDPHLNASFISKSETASLVIEHFSNNLCIAGAGAIGKSIGATAASAKPTISAKGFRPSSWAVDLRVSTLAAAPSFNVLAFAAVTVPPWGWNTVGSDLNFSKLTLLYSSSSFTTVSGLPRFPGTFEVNHDRISLTHTSARHTMWYYSLLTGTISLARRPSWAAFAERR